MAPTGRVTVGLGCHLGWRNTSLCLGGCFQIRLTWETVTGVEGTYHKWGCTPSHGPDTKGREHASPLLF